MLPTSPLNTAEWPIASGGSCDVYEGRLGAPEHRSPSGCDFHSFPTHFGLNTGGKLSEYVSMHPCADIVGFLRTILNY